MMMMMKLVLLITLVTGFCKGSRIVNISDAWILSDPDSSVFYRHFRDQVTWSEAEAVCEFHHSKLATVRNSGEFDRTRELLLELNWITPVWIGLKRVIGQPIFKWSTPLMATLSPSDGYWYLPPDSENYNRALCVTVDPAAEFRWKAVECSSPIGLRSFLCQIQVPQWVRNKCLSRKWPNKEVTIQYLPQTQAIEIIADCGLKGSRRLACKEHSKIEIRTLEEKLECTNDNNLEYRKHMKPLTRHRRDTLEEMLPTPLANKQEASSTPLSLINITIAEIKDSNPIPSSASIELITTTSIPQSTTNKISTLHTAKSTVDISTNEITTPIPTIAPSTTTTTTTHKIKTIIHGTPRNVATLTHVSKHPIFMVTHMKSDELPRNIPKPLLLSHHDKTEHTTSEGTPRIILSEPDIHRSAEDKVQSRRRQFLPKSLRNDEDEDDLQITNTDYESLNSQTEEEIIDGERRRQHSRRNYYKSNTNTHHTARNLYPYIVNRMLG